MDDVNGLKTYLSIQRDENGNVTALQHITGMDFQKENTRHAAGINRGLYFLISAYNEQNKYSF